MVKGGQNNETGRIEALRNLDVLDTKPEAPFENIVALVRAVLGVPIATVTLIDDDRQWFKARSGNLPSETPRNIAFCSYAIEQDRPLIVKDAFADPRFADNPLVTGAPNIRSYAGVQLTTSDGYNVGTLCAIDTKARNYTPGEVALLSDFAKVVVNEMELHRRADQDHLTGALTRQAFTRHAEREINRHQRYDRPATLVLFDIDHFKSINDTWGHGAGDAVLSRLGQMIPPMLRPTDYFARVGGEEFALLLPETSLDQGAVVAERIRQAVAQEPFRSACVSDAITVSCGVVELHKDLQTLDQLMAATDVLLYQAKRSGRNRCEVDWAECRVSA